MKDYTLDAIFVQLERKDEDYGAFFKIIFLSLVLAAIAPLKLSALDSPASVLPATQAPAYSIAVNPVFIPFGTISAEYELKAGKQTSIGVSGWYEYSNVKARWIYCKLLYYFGGNALEGFGVGPTVGAIWSYRKNDEQGKKENDFMPDAGLIAQYNWLLDNENGYWMLGIGVGARAALKELSTDSPAYGVNGDLRLVFGYAFK